MKHPKIVRDRDEWRRDVALNAVGPQVRRARWRLKNPVAISLHAIVVRYGITEDELWSRWRAQGGACACCGLLKSLRELEIEHDQDTGVVRGWVCRRCNIAIGYVESGHAKLAETFLEGRSWLT